jgi:hypothetical protein
MSDHSNPITELGHPAGLPATELRAACDVRFTRRSGPGGQHRNKVETAVVVTHRASGISAEANERRAQSDNLRVALRRLRCRLALALRQPWQQPSARWQNRCRRQRLVVSPQHEDFPGLLAEALDALAACQWQLAEAARRLTCSSSQLVRLLRQYPAALRALNQQRLQRGANRLR